MSDEISAILAAELRHYEERVEKLNSALEELLDYRAEHRTVVLKMIGHRRGRWEHLLAGVRPLYRPLGVSAGDALADALESLYGAGMISLERTGRGRTYVLRSQARRAA